MRVSNVLAAGLIVGGASALRGQTPVPPPPQINTNAEAEAEAPADRATLLVSVETRATTAAAAAADNARRVRTTLDTLRAMGLAKEQIGTFGYSVQPIYSRPAPGGQDGPHVTGYVARNTVRVEIKKVDEAGRLIDAALAGGANSIGGLQFTSTNADSARRDALNRATLQARGDAEAIARAAGGTLGPLLEMSASGQGGRLMLAQMRVSATASAEATPIEAGPLTISVSVNGRWQFVPR